MIHKYDRLNFNINQLILCNISFDFYDYKFNIFLHYSMAHCKFFNENKDFPVFIVTEIQNEKTAPCFH